MLRERDLERMNTTQAIRQARTIRSPTPCFVLFCSAFIVLFQAVAIAAAFFLVLLGSVVINFGLFLFQMFPFAYRSTVVISSLVYPRSRLFCIIIPHFALGGLVLVKIMDRQRRAYLLGKHLSCRGRATFIVWSVVIG